MQADLGAEIKSRFGRAVRKRRLELGLSQEKLGERAGLDRSYVGHVEQGRRNIALIATTKLARGLAIPPSKLFADYEEDLMLTPDEPMPSVPEPGLAAVTDEQVPRVRAKADELGLDPHLLRSLVEILNDLIEEGLNEVPDWLLRYLIAHLGEEETIRRLERARHS